MKPLLTQRPELASKIRIDAWKHAASKMRSNTTMHANNDHRDDARSECEKPAASDETDDDRSPSSTTLNRKAIQHWLNSSSVESSSSSPRLSTSSLTHTSTRDMPCQSDPASSSQHEHYKVPSFRANSLATIESLDDMLEKLHPSKFSSSPCSVMNGARDCSFLKIEPSPAIPKPLLRRRSSSRHVRNSLVLDGTNFDFLDIPPPDLRLCSPNRKTAKPSTLSTIYTSSLLALPFEKQSATQRRLRNFAWTALQFQQQVLSNIIVPSPATLNGMSPLLTGLAF